MRVILRIETRKYENKPNRVVDGCGNGMWRIGTNRITAEGSAFGACRGGKDERGAGSELVHERRRPLSGARSSRGHCENNLGKELARAEQALATGGAYVQDAAPEDGRGTKQLPLVAVSDLLPGSRKNSGCGCGSSCG